MHEERLGCAAGGSGEEIAPQTPAPPQAGGGTSTCGLPGGMATVVIADPSLKTFNVRDRPQGEVITTIPEGSQVEVLGGCGVKLAAGIVAQKPGSGEAPMQGWCAIASPVGCVAEQFLVSGTPEGGTVDVGGAAGIVADQPQATEGPTFTGTWSAEAQGLPYTMSLDQSGGSVTGSYTGGDGSVGEIEGKVSGRVLRFAWRQTDGTSGMGRFKLSGSGNSFTGSYTLGNNPDVAEGAWNGRRQ